MHAASPYLPTGIDSPPKHREATLQREAERQQCLVDRSSLKIKSLEDDLSAKKVEFGMGIASLVTGAYAMQSGYKRMDPSQSALFKYKSNSIGLCKACNRMSFSGAFLFALSAYFQPLTWESYTSIQNSIADETSKLRSAERARDAALVGTKID
jgi:hypothetical protein